MHIDDLARLADEYAETKDLRLKLEKEAEEVKKKESELRQALIDNIDKSDATGVAGKKVRITIVSKKKPTVTDWDALWTHIRRRGDYDLVQRRLSDTAVKARWEEGKEIPGVEAFNVLDLSVSRVK